MPATWRTRIALLSPVFAAALLAVYTPTDAGPTVCPFALVTGTACPGCGMTRAVGYLAKGDLASAIQYHPLVFLIAIQAISGWIWLAMRSRGSVKPLSSRLTSAILIGTAISLGVVWMFRLVQGTLPPV